MLHGVRRPRRGFGDTTTLPFLISRILALVAAPFIITPALGSRPAAPATRPVLR